MLPAVPYRPVTDDEVASLIDAPGAQEPAADPLPGLLATIYRDPVSARQRLDALLVDGREAAAERLRREGPALLGRLRGREGLLASQAAFTERQNATHAAGLLPDALLEPPRRRAALIQLYRGPLESDRQRDTIAVPGHSQAALAAIARLEQAGADRWYRHDTPTTAMSADQVARASRVAAVWLAVKGDERVCRELERFRDAVRRRLEGSILSGSDEAPNGGRRNAPRRTQARRPRNRRPWNGCISTHRARGRDRGRASADQPAATQASS
ncbi:MAG TPA: BID domain-containing protein [Acetobacteraceae bacterium]|nr:BID domain-containing protein [Acetobacteraceae bacterium]